MKCQYLQKKNELAYREEDNKISLPRGMPKYFDNYHLKFHKDLLKAQSLLRSLEFYTECYSKYLGSISIYSKDTPVGRPSKTVQLPPPALMSKICNLSPIQAIIYKIFSA